MFTGHVVFSQFIVIEPFGNGRRVCRTSDLPRQRHAMPKVIGRPTLRIRDAVFGDSE